MDWHEAARLVLTSPVVAAAFAGSFALGSIWLGLRRFRSEKWWERKAAAYAAVIEGLHGIREHASKYADSIENGYDLSDGWALHLDEARAKGMEELRKGAGIGSFVMTKHAADILSAAAGALERASPHELDILSYHQTRAAIAEDTLRDLEREAKRDLRI